MHMTDWFEEGLNFTCTRCSNCCRHDSGYVFLSEADISRLSGAFGLSREEFIDRYCTRVNLGIASRISLNEQPNYDCVFFQEGRCSVYPVRPLQCRSYPFWANIVETPQAWQNEASHCPGINIGPRKSRETVMEWLEARKTQPLVER